MEYRKLIKFGNSSSVVSLPKSWVDKNNLKKGDLVTLDEQEGNLLLTPKFIDSERKPEEIELCLDGLDRTSIMYLIRSVYRKGYDVIRITFNNQTCPHYREGKNNRVVSVIHEEVNRLTGVEITGQKENSCIVRSITEPSPKEFEIVLRRLFLLLMDASDDLMTGVKTTDKALIETIYEKHNTISKFVSYCLRVINKGKFEDKKNAFFMYHIIANLDKITDSLKFCARKVADYSKPLKTETIELLLLVIQSWRDYYDFFYKFDIKKVDKLSKDRYGAAIKMKELAAEKKIPYKEYWMLVEMQGSLELLNDLIEAKISMAH
ncbi:AbrB/MazE/SpoVT family DNA-binding domain-containing protein [Nanoarchaeota archaeon]